MHALGTYRCMPWDQSMHTVGLISARPGTTQMQRGGDYFPHVVMKVSMQHDQEDVLECL